MCTFFQSIFIISVSKLLYYFPSVLQFLGLTLASMAYGRLQIVYLLLFITCWKIKNWLVVQVQRYRNNYIKLLVYMNKYETIETIGQGEYGVVLKALNKETSQLVAIKKFKEDDSQPETKRVILRQVKILKTLNHENIIQLKEAFRRKGKIYLVCQYVQKNLLQILEQTPLTAQRVKNFTYQLLKGVAYMHSQNIIHRDIKPENLLINKNDQVKICDLGFARSLPSNGKMTDYVATRWYRPPELLIGRQDYDTSIDIWSIGCVMAEMIDGEPLFGGQNDLDQLYLIQKCLGPLISDHKEFFLKNQKFVGMKFPQIHVIQSIDRRYFGKIDKLGLDLLKRMLKMDPSQRISAQQALNHPYINRIGTPMQRQTKKPSVFDRQQRSDVNKSHLHINNFLQEKGQKITTRDEKIGVNKVTGFSKANQKFQQKLPNVEQSASPWNFTGKGKSLGKKPAGTSIRDKQFLNEKYSRAKIFKQKKNRNQQQQYAQDWDEIQPQQQKKQIGLQKSDRKQNGQKSEDKSLQNKKKKKLFKKQSVNIVFNQNTYNLNIVEDHN